MLASLEKNDRLDAAADDEDKNDDHHDMIHVKILKLFVIMCNIFAFGSLLLCCRSNMFSTEPYLL